jgi:hypothetical protein
MESDEYVVGASNFSRAPTSGLSKAIQRNAEEQDSELTERSNASFKRHKNLTYKSATDDFREMFGTDEFESEIRLFDPIYKKLLTPVKDTLFFQDMLKRLNNFSLNSENEREDLQIATETATLISAWVDEARRTYDQELASVKKQEGKDPTQISDQTGQRLIPVCHYIGQYVPLAREQRERLEFLGDKYEAIKAIGNEVNRCNIVTKPFAMKILDEGAAFADDLFQLKRLIELEMDQAFNDHRPLPI